MSDIHIGDSISTNGICLTVTNFNNDSYTVDVMPETMMTTNFKNLKINDKLNLERALPVNGRLGGHIVSGHIDGIGTIVRKYKDDKAIRMSFSTSSDILGLIVKKGPRLCKQCKPYRRNRRTCKQRNARCRRVFRACGVLG